MARSPLKVAVEDDAVRIGERFSITFQRTLRIPDDGRAYPLPPGFGRFPVCRVEDYAARVPDEWRRRGGVFLPMYQREALWLAFDAAWWKPNAVQVAVGVINVVSGTHGRRPSRPTRRTTSSARTSPGLTGSIPEAAPSGSS